jgi:pimeloyl-ACP methyl ester carboxylesterase
MLLVLFLLMVSILIILVPHNIKCDYKSPLNMLLFQQPSLKYNKHFVNEWVEKPWQQDGSRIPCLIEYFYAESVVTTNRTLVVYSHGNAENLLTCSRFLRDLSNDLQADTMAYEYSGYGLNAIDEFERSANGVNITLKTVVDHMLQKGYRPCNIILMGYSLGSGPTLNVASEFNKLKGVVLVGAFTSVVAVVENLFNAQIANLFEERWNNLSAISKLCCPILIIHGKMDKIIPSNHANQLSTRNNNTKLIIMPNVGHTNFDWKEIRHNIKTFCINKN